MAQTAFIGPMARKKHVPGKYCPNSYRVISEPAETIINDRPADKFKEPDSIPASIDYNNILGQPPSETRPVWEHRHNRPNPGHVGFLRQDVKLLNEPVCDVYTSSTVDEQHLWWPSRTSKDPLQVPPYTLDTTVRKDYQYRGEEDEKNTRHGANPNTTPALGSVPVNHLRAPDDKQRFWKENMSYEHQYNCRLDPSYPIRGKRHSSFVWDRYPPYQVNQLMQNYGYISNKLQQTENPFDGAMPSPARSASGAKTGSASASAAASPASGSRKSSVSRERNTVTVSQQTAERPAECGGAEVVAPLAPVAAV